MSLTKSDLLAIGEIVDLKITYQLEKFEERFEKKIDQKIRENNAILFKEIAQYIDEHVFTEIKKLKKRVERIENTLRRLVVN